MRMLRPTRRSRASGDFADMNFPGRDGASHRAAQWRNVCRSASRPAKERRRVTVTCNSHITTLKLMQPNRGLTELLMCLERILESAFPGESGAARLQQVALFTLIYLLQRHGKPATASRLGEMSG